MIPGFSVWFFEHVDDEGNWHEVYMHVPDTIETTDGRKAWAKETGAVPETALISYAIKSTCQEHAFGCRARDHMPPPVADALAAESLAALRANLITSANPHYNTYTWEPIRPEQPLSYQDALNEDLGRTQPTWEDYIRDNPAQWEQDLIPRDTLGACGIAGCDCTNDDFDRDPFNHNI